LLEGLTQEEFFFSTYGCRKGLLDVALNTGTSGYLSRKLIFTCANLQIDMDCDDCGTTDCLPVNVKNEKQARMLINRYYKSSNGLLK
jgi:DNA-directed RNA polymerase beta' subunit